MSEPIKDNNGYWRGKPEHSDLISRKIAYEKIYLKNPDKYPLPFSSYIVHHIDGDKDNNGVRNLYICKQEEHEIINEEQRISRKKFANSSEIDYFLRSRRTKGQSSFTKGFSFTEPIVSYPEKSQEELEKLYNPYKNPNHRNNYKERTRNEGLLSGISPFFKVFIIWLIISFLGVLIFGIGGILVIGLSFWILLPIAIWLESKRR